MGSTANYPLRSSYRLLLMADIRCLPGLNNQLSFELSILSFSFCSTFDSVFANLNPSGAEGGPVFDRLAERIGILIRN